MRTRLLTTLLLLLFGPCPLVAQESRIELHNLSSAILGTQKNFNIFLPDGYDQEDERYPVVYLFRGNEREWANPAEDGSRRGNIKSVADALYGDGKIGKVILVMPGLSEPATDQDFAFVLNELIPYIDRSYRTLPSRWLRGMDGFSYGGLSVLELLWRQPEAFSSAGSYDGSYFLFNIQDLTSAPETYWAMVRPIKVLFHGSVIGPSNYDVSHQVLEIFASHGVANGFPELALSSSAQHNWFYADLHMEQSLPLHWQQFQNAPRNVGVTLSGISAGGKISGNVNISWSIASHGEPLNAFLEFSSNSGDTWHQICSTFAPDSTILWKTEETPDGTRYMLRMRALGDTLFGIAQTQGRFTVDNPGNGLPDLELLAPQANETLSGLRQITWWAEDTEGDTLIISIESSKNNGFTWEQLASNLSNTGSYSWDTRLDANSDASKLRLQCNDGKGTSEVVSARFTVANQRPFLADSLLRHIAGRSNARITVHVADPIRLTGHTYRIIFEEPTQGQKTYTVRDIDLNTIVMNGVLVAVGSAEGPLFDGLRLVVTDIDPPRVSMDSTRWIVGKSTLLPQVLLPQIDPGGGIIYGKASASDYVVTVYDHIVDTTSGYLSWPENPVNFKVRNTTEDRQVDVLFTDVDNDHAISRFDDVIILERDSTGQLFPSWELFFTGNENAIPPVPGDVFRLHVLKPLTRADVYEFAASPSGIVSVDQSKVPLEFLLFQNYPNPFNPTTAIRFSVPPQAGGHLASISGRDGQMPGASHVRLVVYDILGREVATLVNEILKPGRYERTLDARGMASGVYFYRLEFGKFVSVKKMLLLR